MAHSFIFSQHEPLPQTLTSYVHASQSQNKTNLYIYRCSYKVSLRAKSVHLFSYLLTQNADCYSSFLMFGLLPTWNPRNRLRVHGGLSLMVYRNSWAELFPCVVSPLGTGVPTASLSSAVLDGT